jgi:hypothetical protein
MIVEAGESLRHIQQLAGHASLQAIEGYIEGDNEAKRKMIAFIKASIRKKYYDKNHKVCSFFHKDFATYYLYLDR